MDQKNKHPLIRFLKKIRFVVYPNKYVLSYWIIGIEIFLYTCITYYYAHQHIDSDSAGELILGHLLSQEKGILSSNWYYLTELKVLNTQLITTPLFSFFDNWIFVRSAATCIFLILLAFSLIFLCKQLDNGAKASLFIPVLFLPFSSQYREFVLSGLYYFPYIITMFFSIGLFIRSCQTSKSHSYVLLIFLAFLSGLGGMRLVIEVYAPLFISCVIIWFFGGITTYSVTKTNYVYVSLTVLSASLFGYIVNSKLLSRFYVFNDNLNVGFIAFNSEKFFNVVSGWLANLGYRTNVNAYTIAGIINLGIVSLSIFIVWICYYLLKNFYVLSFSSKLLCLFFIVSSLTNLFLFAFTSYRFRERYLLIPFVSWIFMIFLYTDFEYRYNSKINVILIALSLTIFASSFVEYKVIICENINRNKTQITEYLMDNDFNFGYASYWNANVFEELSNGTIQICNITDWENLKTGEWGMPMSYSLKPQQYPVFILLTKEEQNEFNHLPIFSSEFQHFENDFYYVYLYDNYDVMYNSLALE